MRITLDRTKTLAGGAAIGLALSLAAAPPPAAAQKLEPRDLVARHLQAIGPADKLAARKTCLAEGTCVMQNTRGAAERVREGEAALVSEGSKYRLRIRLNDPNYRSEQFAFDGRKFETGFLEPGRRSALCLFLDQYGGIGKEGLLGGVLSTAWALLDVQGRGPRLQYRGLKSSPSGQAHELRYEMKRGQDYEMTISLFFDAGSFRHLQTSYTVVQGTNVTELREMFSTFTEVEGLTLPTQLTIQYTVRAEGSLTVTEWAVKFAGITLNRPIDPKVFVITY